MLGAFNLMEKSGTQFHSPTKIIIHDDWNPFVERYDADIAVLLIEDEIIFTNYIKPICLWEFAYDPIAADGFIAGWGKASTSTPYEVTPKQLKIPIIDPLECLLDNPAFAELASKRTFCGGSRDGAGPCLGWYFCIFISVVKLLFSNVKNFHARR